MYTRPGERLGPAKLPDSYNVASLGDVLLGPFAFAVFNYRCDAARARDAWSRKDVGFMFTFRGLHNSWPK